MPKYRLISAATVSLVAVCSIYPSNAADKYIDPQADAVLRSYSQFYGTVSSARVVIDRIETSSADGWHEDSDSTWKASMRRPDHLLMSHVGGRDASTVSCTGTTFTILDACNNSYAAYPLMQGDPEIARNAILQLRTQAQISAPSEGYWLLSQDPYTDYQDALTTCTYEGVNELSIGKLAHQLHLENELFSSELYIRTGPEPVLLMVVSDVTKLYTRGKAPAGLKNYKVIQAVSLSDWELNPVIPDEEFEFVPTPSARPENHLMEQGSQEEEIPYSLLGRVIPSLHLQNMDGSQFELFKARNKQIVVLTFWASWCGTCIQHLPDAAAVAKSFQARDVAYYTVCLQDSYSLISRIFRDKGYTYPVLSDSEGKCFQILRIDNVPLTLVIGKDGSVQAAYSDVRDLPKRLRSDLEILTSGGRLVK